jgi:SNF2 family DNA or RNA helicase
MTNQPPSSGLKDNHRRGKVGDFLRGKLRPNAELSFVSAYFTIYAYEALRSELDHVGHLRFLFGEPRFIHSLDPSRTEEKAFGIADDQLELKNKLEQKRVARECADWIQQKVEIRSVTQAGFLHGKMYHIDNGGVEDAILGSSNFTVRGLGLAATGNNIELNLEVDSSRDRRDLKAWFDELWNDEGLVKDVTAEVLSYLEQLYRNHPPEFIYYKTLFHIFERYLGDAGKTADELAQTTLFESGVWQALYEFQRDGVKGAINKILKHNGCILADSVGLGKTFEALAVIKYFELRNERVLVLCPKKLRENWTVYKLNDQLNPFGNDRFRYDVLSHTDLSREVGKTGDIDLSTINWGNYDLVVVDESHNFRNNTPGKRDEEGKIIRKSRYERMMDDIIKKGVKTKVLLLSATPVNNDLKDLRNQIYFLTEGSDTAFRDSLGIANLKETLRKAQANFTHWARQQPSKRKLGDLLERLGSDFFKLLDELTIARSRKHIQKYYAATIAELGGFPKREKPVSCTPDIDLQGRFLSYDKLNQEISGYKLSLFNPSEYLRRDLSAAERAGYQTSDRDPFSQATRENYLIGMMKVNFLKRLESSVEAFEITMENTISKIEHLERKIANFKSLPGQDPDSAELELDLGETGDEDDREAAQLVGGKYKYQLRHLRLDDWLADLKRDKDQLTILLNAASAVTPERDAKLAELKALISVKVKSPSITKDDEPNRKVIVFTAFADTAKYLYEQLAEWAEIELGVETALVTGSGDNRTTFQPGGYTRATEFNHILTNFSPRAKNRSKMPAMPQHGEIDLLIATDCISEGQNLQDCDYLINYDIHWNPVRIIQRFGRIDRLKSRNHSVQLVNFWPTEDLNNYINLKHRVEARMALVDLAATFEDNVLKADDLEELIQDDLKYRDKQLLRLKDEILDMDDLNEDGISLTQFTLDDFRIDLLKYLEANRAAQEAAPFGLYSVVPPDPEFRVIAPGVVFCFKQTGKTQGSETVNPLQPYFLVYIRDDGNVRFTFAQPKQILDIYRILCAGKSTPNDALCTLFDHETNHGRDMAAYSDLLQKAIASIVHTFSRRAVGQLLLSREAVLPTRQDQATEDSEFDLVTWLVIKEAKARCV